MTARDEVGTLDWAACSKCQSYREKSDDCKHADVEVQGALKIRDGAVCCGLFRVIPEKGEQ